jgi:hypothetical protein
MIIAEDEAEVSIAPSEGAANIGPVVSPDQALPDSTGLLGSGRSQGVAVRSLDGLRI